MFSDDDTKRNPKDSLYEYPDIGLNNMVVSESFKLAYRVIQVLRVHLAKFLNDRMTLTFNHIRLKYIQTDIIFTIWGSIASVVVTKWHFSSSHLELTGILNVGTHKQLAKAEERSFR